jgi:uncharacterized membrane protein YebE (DUF533 family)
MKVSTLIAAGALALTTTTFATAASADRIDQRQANQERRILEGLRDGSLTRREAAQLEAEQARIRAMERAAERDGRIDRAERARIEAAQDAASRHIYAERHDAETRGSGWNRWRRWSRWW